MTSGNQQRLASDVIHQGLAMMKTHLFSLLILVFFFYFVKTRYVTPLRHVPGPFWASLSKFWKIYHIFNARQEVVMQELHKKYGHVVRIGPNEVVISHPDAVKEIYGAGSKFKKTEWFSVWNLGGNSGKWDLFADTNPVRHMQTKRMVSNSYSLTSLYELEPAVQSAVDVFLHRMGEFADSGRTMDLSTWVQWFAFDVIGEVSFSQRFGFLDQGKDINDTLATIEGVLWAGILLAELPALDRFQKHPVTRALIPWIGQYESKMNLIANYTQERIAERRSTASDRRDLLSRFFKIEQENDYFDDRDVFIHAMTNVFAGSDTTSIALRAILYYMIINDRCYQILQEEIDSATRDGRLGEKPTYAQAQKLPYLQAVIKESLRFHPSLGSNHTRYVPEGGMQIAGKYLPAGTTVGINDWAMHRQKSVFGEDAEIYRPERWIEGNAKVMEKHFMTFGLGGHVCIGKNIALLEINNLVPQIFRSFTLRLADPNTRWRIVSHTFVVQKDIHVTVHRREAASGQPIREKDN